MANIEVKPADNQREWEAFLAAHPESNFLQAWQWGEFHEALGKAIFRRGYYKDGRLVGVMLSVVEPARRGRYLTVPGGPIIDWHDAALAKTFVREIGTQAKAEKCVFVRVRPQLLSDDFSVKLFAKLGFRPAPSHLHAELTQQLDITRPEEEILSKMRKGTKYEVKNSLKVGVEVVSSTDAKDMQAFYDLQIETAKRQGFVPFSYNFLEKQFEVFTRAGQALLYTARYNGDVLAQAFIIFQGQEAVYHYGASTPAGRNYPGAYAIQWEAIKEAKRRGMSRYNFWGIAPPDQPGHRFAGITTFKRGFGGEAVEYLHARDLVINKPHYLVNLIIEETRRRVRRV
ncbi:MAG TPA: peptidoglycan bridge formation glycyltransferase FemA/FemB family protein [Candidatus Polarisedimenticolaceae bacterium]|nr:peptidoglycan bridge formation glycyltransferase FemA/FemB family protein [Candidatus Polarisedimenticolaceae bacterium]